jgi:hypothetical protein
MPVRIDRYIDKVQNDIVSCPNDQPCEGGAGTMWITDSPIPLQDLLSQHNVPERLWNDVACQLRCPKCDSSLVLWQDVGTRPQFELVHEQQIEKALLRHNKELNEFTSFMRTNPYLGALHTTGKKIIRELAKFPKSTLTNQKWFRARKVQTPNAMTADDLRPPDPQRHVIPEGRFNHFGQACWYLASDPKVAAAEATSKEERLVWIQQWQIEQLNGVLDLRAWQPQEDRSSDTTNESHEFSLLQIALIFGDHLNARPEQNSSWGPEYFVPRFVADAASRDGFSGMIFRSVRSFGENLVLFDPQTELLPIGKPELIRLDENEAQRRDGMFMHQGFPISFTDIPKILMPASTANAAHKF